MEVFAWGLATELIILTLQPVGALVDGTTGRTVTAQLRLGYLDDVPLGKYTITVKIGSPPLLVRKRNAEQMYAKSVTASFDPAYAGVEGRYKLNLEVSE